jgi:hypothetical protein
LFSEPEQEHHGQLLLQGTEQKKSFLRCCALSNRLFYHIQNTHLKWKTNKYNIQQSHKRLYLWIRQIFKLKTIWWNLNESLIKLKLLWTIWWISNVYILFYFYSYKTVFYCFMEKSIQYYIVIYVVSIILFVSSFFTRHVYIFTKQS